MGDKRLPFLVFRNFVMIPPMTNSNRQTIFIGNWKMYHGIDASLSFLKTFEPLVHDEAACRIYLAVPFTSIAPMAEAVKDTPIVIGAQNMHDASEGAFTGEIAAEMLLSAGAKFVIVGHSERRRLFNEDNSFINRKVKRALQDGLQPVLCVGETLEERQAGQTEQVLEKQLSECLEGVTAEQISTMILAYEPVWAIGSDQPATPEQAQEAHHQCRALIEKTWDSSAAKKISILYGGSVKPDNAAGFLDQSDVDGLLVGAASLSPETFSQIIKCQSTSLKE